VTEAPKYAYITALSVLTEYPNSHWYCQGRLVLLSIGLGFLFAYTVKSLSLFLHRSFYHSVPQSATRKQKCVARFFYNSPIPIARGNAVGWGTMLQAGRSRVRFPMRSLDFFNWPNPSSRTVSLGLTQPLTEMSIRNLPGGKGRSARKPDNFTAIWGVDCLENVGASTSHNPTGLHGLLQE
jgi:hypothetical protein